MKNGIKIIDLEHHFATEGLATKLYGPNWLEGASEAGASSEVLDMAQAELGDADQIVARMDAAGIDFSQLSLITPGSEAYEVEENKALATEANDRVASFIAKYPDRIGGFMALVPQDIEWSLKEFDRCANMGLWGWCTMSNYGGTSRLDDPKYLPLIEKCAQHNMPIFIHPYFPANKEMNEVGYCLEGPAFGFTVDTQLTFFRMLYRGIFDKFPNLKILLGHNAEGLSIYLDRVDTPWRQGMGQPKPEFGSIAHEPSYYLKHNLYGNTSGNFDTNVLRFSAFKLGADRLVLGTDDPCESAEGTQRSVSMILEDEVFTFEQKRKMLQDNAEALGFGVSHLSPNMLKMSK